MVFKAVDFHPANPDSSPAVTSVYELSLQEGRPAKKIAPIRQKSPAVRVDISPSPRNENVYDVRRPHTV